jgi:hypothetical protein
VTVTLILAAMEAFVWNTRAVNNIIAVFAPADIPAKTVSENHIMVMIVLMKDLLILERH